MTQTKTCIDHANTQRWAPVTYLKQNQFCSVYVTFGSIMYTCVYRPKDKDNDKDKDKLIAISMTCVDHPNTQHGAPVTYLCWGEQCGFILYT